MIKSMTGYGRGKYEIEGRNYTVEIKAVNHKYSDISIKMPRSLSFLEEKVKKAVLNQISRGKIDVFVTFSNDSGKGKEVKINKELAKIYINEIMSLKEETNLNSNIDIMEVIKLPDILVLENKEDENLLWAELNLALQMALNSFVEMRKEEGSIIAKDISDRIRLISEKIEKISTLSTGLVEEYIVKLEERIKELLNVDIVDQTRLAQEIVIYSDKCSIQEELTRLRSHIEQFSSFLQKEEPIGKNMDFLIQEMNRETNTIGSKANKLEITRLVVEIKTIIEDIREQIQNIE